MKSLRTWFAVVLLCVSCSASLAQDKHESDPTVNEELSEILSDVECEFVVLKDSLVVATRHGQIRGEPAGPDDIEKYAPMLLGELKQIPKSALENSEMKRLVLCCRLSFAKQNRSAIPDFEHDTLYLDVQAGSKDSVYQRRVIHHEWYHLVDFRDDGVLYDDKEWKKLNPSTFRYGDGGRNAQGTAGTGAYTKKYAGFLNHYSTTGVEEDKAEIFSAMMVAPQYVGERCKEDPVLQLKVRMMERLMNRFSAEFDRDFWKKE